MVPNSTIERKLEREREKERKREREKERERERKLERENTKTRAREQVEKAKVMPWLFTASPDTCTNLVTQPAF